MSSQRPGGGTAALCPGQVCVCSAVGAEFAGLCRADVCSWLMASLAGLLAPSPGGVGEPGLRGPPETLVRGPRCSGPKLPSFRALRSSCTGLSGPQAPWTTER